MTRRLLVIGGHEEKSPNGDRAIVEWIARAAAGTRLVVVTVATTVPDDVWQEYRRLFQDLGVRDVVQLDVRTRTDALDPANVALLTDGAVVLFTGGDQLRITSQVGDSGIFRRLHDLHRSGSLICGTSAGAAVMPETMLVRGPSDTSGELSSIAMAPGLGFLQDVVIDSHFAERGRMGRLISAVAQNPSNLGLGIDEDTAIAVEEEGDDKRSFTVIGRGAVYVLDGTHVTYSSLSDVQPEGVLTVCGITMHVLAAGEGYDLAARRPFAEIRERAPAKGEATG
jgi:cyanophycinase